MSILKKAIVFATAFFLFTLLFVVFYSFIDQSREGAIGQNAVESTDSLENESSEDNIEENGSEGSSNLGDSLSDSMSNKESAILDLTFVGYNAGTVTLSWPDSYDEETSDYVIFRKALSNSENSDWTEVTKIESDRESAGDTIYFNDYFPTIQKAQYLYCVECNTLEESKYSTIMSNEVVTSNVVVCIDPGHYKNSSTLRGDNLYGYNEGDFVLKLGHQLSAILKKNYGISSIMTRTEDDITLGGHTNSDLDQKHLSLRGEYAAGCDLFISLHTNANLDNVNGYPTCNQPYNITKTLVFLNTVGSQTPSCITQANTIGTNLSRINHSIGIASISDFITSDGYTFHDWSDQYNDSLDTPGAVCMRLNDSGGDYYGVLRGASAVGVPGMIVEHAHHTVAETRQYAMTNNLADLWAVADAEGIAAGYSFVSSKSQ